MAELKYAKNILAKKTVKELRELAVEEGTDEEVAATQTKTELIADLVGIEVPEDEEELDDELDEEELDDEELPDEEEDDIEADEPEEVKPAAKKKSTAKAKASADDGSTMAAKQVATILGTEAKTLRQFFRSPASTIEPVGSGGRYEFLETDVPKIKAEFDAWKAGHASRGAKRTGEAGTKSRGKRGAKVAEVTEVEEVEELEIEELEDDELDDEELELEDEE
jgi:hypothetical protein